MKFPQLCGQFHKSDLMTTQTKTYSVVLFREDGTHKVLAIFETYKKADRAVDMFSELYPYGFVDVLIR